MRKPIDKLALSETMRACLEAASGAALSVCNAGWTADKRGLQFFHTGTVDALIMRGLVRVEGHGRHRLAFITANGQRRLLEANETRAADVSSGAPFKPVSQGARA